MITDEIIKKKSLYPFHMPGHKRNKNFIEDDLLELDITEIEGLDNLHNAEGIIKIAQDDCAKIFGSRQSFFVVNGASSAIMASIFSVCGEKDEIIVMRASHKSLYNALELSGVMAHYLYGKNFFGINCGIDCDELENLLNQKSNVKAVFITNPNYEGFYLDIKKICEIVHRHKKILIVDEAHGSHFIFHDSFPDSALKFGADIVINSLHKTLPCLTQSAVLHINSDFVDIERVKKYLAIFQTSSPSYIFMGIMEKTIKNLSRPGFYNNYVEKLVSLREKLHQNKIVHLLNKNDIYDENFSIIDLDISKFTFLINSSVRPYEIEQILRNEFNLQIEMCGLNHFIALSSVADTDFGFEMLLKAVQEIEKRLSYKKLVLGPQDIIKLRSEFSLKQAALENKKYVLLDKCTNKISGDFIIPYPPGIPLMVPGEKINDSIINKINQYMSDKINVIGVREKKILVLDKF